MNVPARLTDNIPRWRLGLFVTTQTTLRDIVGRDDCDQRGNSKSVFFAQIVQFRARPRRRFRHARASYGQAGSQIYEATIGLGQEFRGSSRRPPKVSGKCAAAPTKYPRDT